MDTTFIYGLNDPETGECRYVGKANDPHDRLFGTGGHIYDCKTKKHHCANWIRSLVTRGLVPHLEILQEVPKSEWKLWERVWIKASRKIGMNLTNSTDGGENPPSHKGKKRSLETRKKLSESKRGEKNPLFGKTGAQHTSFGRKHSLETLRKISVANSGENGAWFGKVGPTKVENSQKRLALKCGRLNWAKRKHNHGRPILYH